MRPIISIIIVNFNYGRFLESAIRSVVDQQGFDKCELIVVDGGSSDNSVEIIKKYASKIVWWCSEKDKGQSDAFNKGFAKARGVFGCWVNADDVLLSGAIETVVGAIAKDPDHIDWIGGATVWLDANLIVKRCAMCQSVPYFLQRYMPAIIVGGPSAFFRIDLLRKLGGFDVSMYYMMDHDLWLRLAKYGAKLCMVKRYIWGFRLHEESKTAGNVRGSNVSGRMAVRSGDSRVLENRYPLTMRYWHLLCAVFKIIKIFTGCHLISLIDTLRFKGRNVVELRQHH